MSSASVTTEVSTHYRHHDRHLSHSSDYSHLYQPAAYRPAPMEPPRLPEPRPTLEALKSQPPPSVSHVRQEAPRNSFPAHSEPRPQGQSLPGLRDILSPASQSSPNSTYTPSWSSASNPPNPSLARDNYYYQQYGLHPPMTLQPPPDSAQGYQPQQRRYDLPNNEYSRQPVSLPVSPYTRQPESHEQHSDTRSPRHGPTTNSPYTPHTATSPYVHAPSDDGAYGSHVPTFERGVNSGLTPSGNEGQKKYLGVKEVPGEGTFHLYEGGFRLPTHVDGEQVNPAWGLTKANKPRKRLALACLDCREKKIKCEPGTTSCVQCEKAKRPCRKSAALHPSSDPTTTPVWPANANSPGNEHQPSSDPATAPTIDYARFDSVNKRRPGDEHSPIAFKRPRSTSPPMTTLNLASGPRDSIIESTTATSYGSPRDHKRLLVLEDDPYAVLPDLTLYLMEIYFVHVSSSSSFVLPRRHFMRWLTTSREKRYYERVVLYAMLARASLVAAPQYADFGRNCGDIATDALAAYPGRMNMCVAFAQLLLCSCAFAAGKVSESWALSGAAITCVRYLQLDSEGGCVDGALKAETRRDREGFDLSPDQAAECCRRIYWSLFCLERLTSNPLCCLKSEDTFLRLPCADDLYERGVASYAPFLANAALDSENTVVTPEDHLAPGAWMVMISSILGDVVNFTTREENRRGSGYRDVYETFYAKTLARIDVWLASLPDYLRYSRNSKLSLDQPIQHGYANVFITIYTLYHFTLMKLNRFARHALLTPESIKRNIRAANKHGHEMLDLLTAVVYARRDLPPAGNAMPMSWGLTIPFVGYAALMAIDIVAAGGPESHFTPAWNNVKVGIQCIEELRLVWRSAESQHNVAFRRSCQLDNIMSKPDRNPSGAWLQRNWGLATSHFPDLKHEYDVTYGLDQRIYFEAMKDV